MVFKNLIVSKIVGRVKHKELVLVFVSERNYNLTFKNHVQLAEIFASSDNHLIRDVNSAVERRYKEWNKLIANITRLVGEHVTELTFEISK